MSDQHSPVVVGRYLLHRKIARGGMATIHIARLLGDVGFSRIVAAKRMHPELAEDAEFVAMFLDEARIASRVQHRNVVGVLDVVTLGEEVMLVQEYVHGVPLGVLLREAYDQQSHVPVPVAAAIACQVLAGLHAAHESVDELGTPLDIVHRDVSPQNVLIAMDGTARLLDFGVAKAALSMHVTRKGTFKGKLGYSSPEQIRGEAQRQSDIYSLGVVLWEMVVGHRLHALAQSDAQLIAEIMDGKTPTITEALADERAYAGGYRWSQLEAIEPVIRKALDTSARRRWQTAAEMEEAIAAVVPLAPAADVTAWLRAVGKDFLEEREKMIAEEEASWRRNGQELVRAGSQNEGTSAPITPSEAPARPSFLGRAPMAFFATLVVSLVATVVFLMRDLDGDRVAAQRFDDVKTTPSVVNRAGATDGVDQRSGREPATENTEPTATRREPATEATTSRREEPAMTRREEPTTRREEPTTRREEPTTRRESEQTSTRQQATNDRPETAATLEAEPTVPVTKPRPNVVRPPPRRAAPVSAPVAPPPKPAAAALDCSTPFYFEGRKKIFKPGCL